MSNGPKELEKKKEEKKKPGEIVPKKEKKKSKKQLLEEKKAGYEQKKAEKEAEEEFQKWKKEQEWAEEMKKVEPHAAVDLKKKPGDLDTLLTKSVYAFEKKASKNNVVNIILDLQAHIHGYAKGEDAEELGKILLKMVARRPDTWEALKELAAKEGKKGGYATMAVKTVEDAITALSIEEKFAEAKGAKEAIKEIKKVGISPAEVDDWLETFRRLTDQSRLENHEMMRVIGVIEYAEKKPPLEITTKWLSLHKLKHPPTMIENAALLIELHRRGTVSPKYLVNYAFKLEDQMFDAFPEDLKAFRLAFQDVIGESKKLDEAILKALKHEEMEPVLGSKFKGLLDKSDSLVDFMEKLGKMETPEAKNMLTILKAMRENFDVYFIVRTTILEIAAPQIGEKLKNAQAKRASQARKLFQSLQKSIIGEKIGLFGKSAIVEKTYIPGKKLFGAWGSPKKTKTWRPKAAATWEFIKKNKVALGIAGTLLILGYAGYHFFYKKPTEKAIEEFRKDFREDFGIEFPLSDEAIKYYYGTDEGKIVLKELEDIYPKEEDIKNLFEYELATVDDLKENVLSLSGKFIVPEKFGDLLEDLMKSAEKSDLTPETLVGNKLKEWREKGYVVTTKEHYIINYCGFLGIQKEKKFKKKKVEEKGIVGKGIEWIGSVFEEGPEVSGVYKDYEVYYDYTYDKAKYFIKNEEEFLKMWDLVNTGQLPRSMAKEYAKIAMGALPWEEKKKKLDGIVLKVPIAKGSVMDVLDQYAVINGDFREVYMDILEMYKKDPEARKNLNSFKIKEGHVIYGNLFGLISFAHGVAKGEITKENDPRKKLISGDAKFMKAGKIKEKHYWLWIGDSSIMKYFPDIATSEKGMNFLLKYSKFEKGKKGRVEVKGMLGWFLGHRKFIKNPSKVLKYFGLGWKTLDEKYWNKDKKTYNYEGIVANLNTKIPILKGQVEVKGKKLDLWREEKKDIAYSLPTDLIPRGRGAVIGVGANKKKVMSYVKGPKHEDIRENLIDIYLPTNNYYEKLVDKYGKEAIDGAVLKFVNDQLFAYYYTQALPEETEEEKTKKEKKVELARRNLKKMGIILLTEDMINADRYKADGTEKPAEEQLYAGKNAGDPIINIEEDGGFQLANKVITSKEIKDKFPLKKGKKSK